MRTWQLDITLSTCKDYIANGEAIPDCQICKCNCQTGMFTKKDLQPIAVEKAMKNDLHAHASLLQMYSSKPLLTSVIFYPTLSGTV